MKKTTVISLSIVFTLLLSSCSMHLGLSKLLGTSKSSATTKVKHVKATHTPPSPSSAIVGTQAPNTVIITKQGYQPNPLQVKVGTTVTWMNTDSAPHTVTADTAGTFDSGPITPNTSFMYTFSQAGTFTYHSTSDTNVAGTIVVTQ